MATLTPQEKQIKKTKDNLKIIHNRILSKFSFHEIKTWRDVYTHLGYDSSYIEKNFKATLLDTPVVYPELKAFFQKQIDDLILIKNGASTHVNEEKKQEQKKIQSGEKACLIMEALDEKETNVIPNEQRIQKELGNRESPKSIQSINTTDSVKTEEGISSKGNYGYEREKHVKAFLYWFQKKAATELKKKIVDEHKSGVLLLAPTGVGKTFIIAAVDEWLAALNWHDDRTMSHIQRLFITKTTVVEQVSRVFKTYFNIQPNVDTEVINIEQLRSDAGKLWVKEVITIEDGEEKVKWIWKKNIQPSIVFFDESQGAKNKGSKQSKIIYAYNDLPKDKACLVSISASPFTRVSEAQAFAVSTHRPLEHLGFPVGTVLTNENWPSYAAIMSHPWKPEDHKPAAVDKMVADLEDWIVRVVGVRPQFKAVNGVKIIQFENDEKRKFYFEALRRFEEEMRKINDAKDAGIDTGICHLTVLLKFAMAAEFIHAEHFADNMYAAWLAGKAPVAAPKFKGTVIEIVRLLIEKHGIKRDNISLIWGGGQTQLTDKQKAKNKVKSLKEKFDKMGIEMDEMIMDMGLDEVEDRVIVEYPEEWRLGPQDKTERQSEIDKFQSGESQFCIYTLKAGGVGLSLHHTDDSIPSAYKVEAVKHLRQVKHDHPLYKHVHEGNFEAASKSWQYINFNEYPGFKLDHKYLVWLLKCRRKESGYAVEEDIPFVPVRQRETFCTVSYNAIELVQGVGRVPRLTSLSETIQNVYCYAGTVEVDMGQIYSKKLKCLGVVVKAKEDWVDIIFSSSKRAEKLNEVLSTTEGAIEDDSGLVSEEDDEE